MIICKHSRLSLDVSAIGHSHCGDGVVVDVWCHSCGQPGSLAIQTQDVQWGEHVGVVESEELDELSESLPTSYGVVPPSNRIH